jgi:hypothetical protein
LSPAKKRQQQLALLQSRYFVSACLYVSRDNKCPAGEAWHLSGVSTAAIIDVAKIKIYREKDTYSSRSLMSPNIAPVSNYLDRYNLKALPPQKQCNKKLKKLAPSKLFRTLSNTSNFRIYSFLGIFSTVACVCTIGSLSCLTQPAQGQILRGGIEERATPVQDKFRIGSTFSEDLLPGNHKIKEWYKLPAWLTGGFESKTLKLTTLLGAIESKNETTCIRGLQADKTGTVWDAVIIPNYAKVKTVGATDFDIFEEYKVLETTPEKFRCEIKYTAITVDDESHKILRAEKRSELQELIPEAHDAANKKVIEYSKQMRYDQDGKPLTRRAKKLEVVLFPISKFKPIDQSPGGTFNYKEEFRNYLTESGQADLIPEEPQATEPQKP